jgi:hypothetical protein
MAAVNAAALKVGDVIPTSNLGDLTVTEVFLDEQGVMVDVQPGPKADVHDMRALAAATGAQEACWLRGLRHPDLRYRLHYETTREG